MSGPTVGTTGWRRRGNGAWRRGIPVLFLLLSLGVAGFGAFEAYRAERSHRETATGVLRDYGEFAAWSYAGLADELVGRSLDGSFDIVRSNTRFSTGHATAQCLALLLQPPRRSCDCLPSVAGDWSFYARLGAPGDAQWGGDPPDDGGRERALEAVAAHARDVYRGGWGHALVRADGGGPTVAYLRIVVPRLQTTRALEGRGLDARMDTLLYGFAVDPQALAGLYDRALGQGDLLPPSLTRGRANREVVRIDVLEADGAVRFASDPGTSHEFAATQEVPARYGGGTLVASVMPDVANQLVIGGLPENRSPVLLMIFFMAAALAGLAVVQLRRENRLALLRQDFVASVSHELRTPLAQVRLFTETLRLGRVKNEEQKEWALENIDRETLRLSHLVENILLFSRAERGLQAAERERVDLAGEVADVLRSFAPLVPATKATFEVEVDDGLAVEVHRDSLRQVLLNFLDNAVRYGPAGQTIRITGHATGGAVRLAVEDEGPGVAPAERTRIFEPFRRGGQAVGSVVAGSGIGLSVVRDIAETHGGSCRVEDAPGGGARFVFELPALHTARDEHFRAPDAGSGAADRADTRDAAGAA